MLLAAVKPSSVDETLSHHAAINPLGIHVYQGSSARMLNGRLYYAVSGRMASVLTTCATMPRRAASPGLPFRHHPAIRGRNQGGLCQGQRATAFSCDWAVGRESVLGHRPLEAPGRRHQVV
jgi:hypothetical protein